MQPDSKAEFGKWRAYFWPIHSSELRKFLPMFLIFFLISLNYNLLRVFKDSMVITAPNAGAEVIPFIKVWAILPSAIILTYLFTRLANRFDREKVFYIMMSIFIVFFFLFAFLMYPNRDILHPHEFADRMEALLPSGFKGLIAIFRNWTFTLFYVMSELWSTAIMSVLFFGFANEVTQVGEARRYYGLFMIGANIASIFAGQASCWAPLFNSMLSIPYGKSKWEQSILFMSCIVILCGIICIVLFRWLNKYGIGPKDPAKVAFEQKEKIKMSMRKNFSYLANSKYLISIALIVVMYNIAINLVEVVWKNQIKAIYPDPSDFQAYMGNVTTAIGVVSTLASLFISGNVIRRFSWTTSAMIPVATMLITGAGFFIFAIFQEATLASSLTALIGFTPTAFAMFLGTLQNIFARACKFTFFDATKEIAFIPLDPESKLKGKAAIDGVGSRIGKSGGSVIHQGLLLLFVSVSSSAPYVAIIFLAIVLVWLFSVLSLGKQFNQLVGIKPSSQKTEPLPN